MQSAIVISILVFITACSGALFKPGAWYQSLKKPSWTPPNWAFPLVWSVLYIMIAAAGWIIWQVEGYGPTVIVWSLNLALNALWSALFFGAKRMDLAFVNVCLLWLTTALFIVLALQISGFAAMLFVPYLIWVTIAACLNRAVWMMNANS